MNHSSAASSRSLYLYVLVVGNLVAVATTTILLLGVLAALGLIGAVTDTLSDYGWTFDSADNGTAVLYSFTFLASVLSLAASWKMLRERPRLWLLMLVIAFQLASVLCFHNWVSVIPLVPLVAAVYGLVLALWFTPRPADKAAGTAPPVEMTPVAQAPVATTAAGTPPDPAAPQCAHCGSINTREARFCSCCGAILPG